MNYLGDPDNGVILAGYLGSWLMAGGFLAVGSCVRHHKKPGCGLHFDIGDLLRPGGQWLPVGSGCLLPLGTGLAVGWFVSTQLSGAF